MHIVQYHNAQSFILDFPEKLYLYCKYKQYSQFALTSQLESHAFEYLTNHV